MSIIVQCTRNPHGGLKLLVVIYGRGEPIVQCTRNPHGGLKPVGMDTRDDDDLRSMH